MTNPTSTRSTRHLVVDERFAGLLSEDTGIPAPTVLKALAGEPKHQAIEVCLWASRTEDPAHALISWARKYKRGAFRKARRNMSPKEQRAALDARAEGRVAS